MRRIPFVLAAAAAIVSTIACASLARAGSPHTSTIDRLAIAPDASAAFTHDSLGGLRFWPSLDGGAEPIRVPPAQSVASLSIARGTGGAYTLAVLDSAGGAKIYRATATSVKQTGSVPATAPLTWLLPLPKRDALLGLTQDRSIVLLSGAGKTLVDLSERGVVADQICLSSDGTRALVYDVVADALRRVSIVHGEKSKIELDPETIPLPKQEKLARLASHGCNPDLSRWAIAQANANEIEIVVVDTKDGTSKAFKLPMDQYHLAFLSNDVLLATSLQLGAASWRIDLGTDRTTAREGSSNGLFSLDLVAAAAGRRVQSRDNWLLVEDVDRRTRRWLGYETLAPQGAALSPAGNDGTRMVAWLVLNGSIVVEPVKGGGAHVVQPMPGRRFHQALFLDAEHLVTVDDHALIRLIHWRSGKEKHRADGVIAWQQYELEPTTRLLKSTNGGLHRVWTISLDEGFSGPHLIPNFSYLTALVPASKPSETALVTIDSASKVRRYTLAELRGDLTRDEIMEAEEGGPVEVAPFAIDTRGRTYSLTYPTGTATVTVVWDKERLSLDLGSSDVSYLIPSPDGKRILIGRSTGAIDAYEVDGGKKLWSRAAGIGMAIWSRDGKTLVVTVGLGGMVLDGATGEPLLTRCTGRFHDDEGAVGQSKLDGLLPSDCEL